MLTIEKVLILSRVDLFAGLPGESLAEIAAVAEEMELAAGQKIDSAGERCSAMYVVATGKVQLCDGEQNRSAFGPGEAFWEKRALDPGGEESAAAALEDALLLRIESEHLFDLIGEDPELAKTIIRSLCRRVR